MALQNYDIIYVLGNFFMAYVIFKFMHIFYTTRKVSVFIELTAYFSYFILITITHVFLKLPIIVMVANIILLFLLTLLYEGRIKKSMLSVLMIYFSLMSIETIFVVLTSVLQLNLLVPFQYESAFGIIVIRIASLALVFAVQGFKNVRNEYPISNVYWLSLLCIPVGTIIMLFAIFMNTSLSRPTILLSIVSALLINTFTFYLYDKISDLLVSQMNKRIAEEQNRYYEYQVHMMKVTLEKMRTLRHDLKNRVSPLYPLAVAGRKDELLERLSELTDICNISKEYATSGNSTVDSIINFKLQQSEAQGIAITTDILLPPKLEMPTFDIAVIIGNLLDNALEATVRSPKRWIDIKINYTKGRLIIEIQNSFDGVIHNNSEGIQTRKEDKSSHGLGIKSIQTSIKKFDGVMKIHYDETTFSTKVLMYL